jgi:hypothetical protein
VAFFSEHHRVFVSAVKGRCCMDRALPMQHPLAVYEQLLSQITQGAAA